VDSKYLKYSAEEFAADELFQKWVADNKESDSDFWSKWIKNNSEKIEEVDVAKRIIKIILFKNKSISKKAISDSWKEIQPRIILKDLDNTFKTKRNFSVWTKIAASIVILLTVGSLIWVLNSGGNSDSYTDFIVPNGQQSSVTLSDGTVVRLNSGSKLSYSCKFGKKQRLVKLEGQAFFDVVEDKNRPFIVKTKHLDVEVLGTAFDVMAYPNEGIVRTTLVRGKVKVSMPNTASEIIKPGQACFYSVYSENAQVKYVNTEEYTSWKEGQIHFKNETLENIARNLERKYNVTIVIENQMIAKERYTGEFIKEDP